MISKLPWVCPWFSHRDLGSCRLSENERRFPQVELFKLFVFMQLRRCAPTNYPSDIRPSEPSCRMEGALPNALLDCPAIPAWLYRPHLALTRTPWLYPELHRAQQP